MFRFLVIAAIIALGNARAPFLDNRIVGGQNVFITQFPYQLALEIKGRQGCGATLIRPNIAITAAHCVMERHPIGDYKVRAGSSYLEQFGMQAVVQAIYIHPRYANDHTLDYDVAVMILDSSLRPSAQIQIIDLIEKGKKIPAGTMGIISGWGVVSENGKRSNQLQAAMVPNVKDVDCSIFYFDKYQITNRMMCFGYYEGGKDTCQGDSGGPLVVNGKLAGVTSFGNGCGRAMYPGVYTKLSNPVIHDFISTFLKD